MVTIVTGRKTLARQRKWSITTLRRDCPSFFDRAVGKDCTFAHLSTGRFPGNGTRVIERPYKEREWITEYVAVF